MNVADRTIPVVTAANATVLADDAEITPLPRFDGAMRLKLGTVTHVPANGPDTVCFSVGTIDQIGVGYMAVPNGEAVLLFCVDSDAAVGLAITTKGVRSFSITGAEELTTATWAAVANTAYDTEVAWGGGGANRWDIAITADSADAVTVNIYDHVRGTTHTAARAATGVSPLDVYIGWLPDTLAALYPLAFGESLGGYPITEIGFTAESLSAAAAQENDLAATMTVTTLGSTGTYTYSLVAGTGDTDNAKYTVTSNTLLVGADPLAEGTDNVRVRATHSSGWFTEQQFEITVAA